LEVDSSEYNVTKPYDSDSWMQIIKPDLPEKCVALEIDTELYKVVYQFDPNCATIYGYPICVKYEGNKTLTKKVSVKKLKLKLGN
jgi:hypothetical protein